MGQNGSTELKRRHILEGGGSSVPGSPASRDQSFFSSHQLPSSRKGYTNLSDSATSASATESDPQQVEGSCRSPAQLPKKCLQMLYHPNRKKLEEQHKLQPIRTTSNGQTPIDDDGLEEINLLDNYADHPEGSESKDL